MKILAFVLILLFIFSSPVYAVSRGMELEADGIIEYNTVAENSSSKVGLDITGEGQISISNEGSYGEDSVSQHYSVVMQSSEETLRPLRAVTAAFVNGQVYAMMVAPSQGQAGMLDARYELGVGDLFASQFQAEAVVDEGEFRSYVYITEADRDITLEEFLRVRGYVRFVDLITVSIPAEE